MSSPQPTADQPVPGPPASDPRAGGNASGIAIALLSAAAFSTSGTFGKALFAAGWSPGAALLVRVGGAAVVMLVPTLVALRGRWHLVRDNLGLIVTFGLVSVVASQLFYFRAVTSLSVGVALLLEYMAPVVVVAWLWLSTRRRPAALTLAGTGLALLGLVLMLDFRGSVSVDPAGVGWGLAAAVCLGTYFLLSARPVSELPPLVMAGAAMAVGTIALGLLGVTGIVGMVAATDPVPFAGREVTWLVPAAGLVAFPAVTGYTTGVISARRLGAKVASFVGLVEVLFAVVLAWAWLGELPRPVQLLGGGLIVCGVVAVRWDEMARARRGRRRARVRPDPSGSVPAQLAPIHRRRRRTGQQDASHEGAADEHGSGGQGGVPGG